MDIGIKEGFHVREMPCDALLLHRMPDCELAAAQVMLCEEKSRATEGSVGFVFEPAAVSRCGCGSLSSQ
jgi:hypothetical protein